MNKHIQSNSGSSIVAAMAFLFIITAVGLGYLNFSSYEAEQTNNAYRQLIYFWKAEEGQSQARAHIANVVNPDHEVLVTDDDGINPGVIARDTIKLFTDLGTEAYLISTHVYDLADDTRKKRAPTSLVKFESIEEPKFPSNYFMLFHVPGLPYFDTGDTIDGMIHSNTYFKITGNPVFKSVLEAHDNPGFEKLSFKDAEIPKIVRDTNIYNITRMADLIRSKNDSGIYRNFPVVYGKNINIRILENGILEWRYHDVSNTLLYGQINRINYKKYPGIYVDGSNVEVSGVLDGRLTIGCSKNIIITGDLIYKGSNPKTGEPARDSKSILGLIAENDVNVCQDQEGLGIGSGIIIDAAIIAMNRSFQVTNYRKYTGSMGTMHLWGCIIQYERGIIGTVQQRGSRRLGYTKNWHYDTRLANGVVPKFFAALRNEKGLMAFRTILWKRA